MQLSANSSLGQQEAKLLAIVGEVSPSGSQQNGRLARQLCHGFTHQLAGAPTKGTLWTCLLAGMTYGPGCLTLSTAAPVSLYCLCPPLMLRDSNKHLRFETKRTGRQSPRTPAAWSASTITMDTSTTLWMLERVLEVPPKLQSVLLPSAMSSHCFLVRATASVALGLPGDPMSYLLWNSSSL
jgi:hypothetical protein